MPQLRVAPSGKVIVGLNQDDVLLWDVPSQQWIPGPSPGGAVGSNDVVNQSSTVPGDNVTQALGQLRRRMPTVLYVAQGALAEQPNGSPIAPFGTMAEAMDALNLIAALDPTGDYGLVVYPGDYSAETVAAFAEPGSLSVINVLASRPVGFSPSVSLPAIAGGGGQLFVAGAYIGGALTGWGAITLEQSVISSSFEVTDLRCTDTEFNNACVATVYNGQLTDCFLDGDGGSPNWIISSRLECYGTKMQNVIFNFPGIGGTLAVDATSNYFLLNAGCSTTGVVTKSLIFDDTP